MYNDLEGIEMTESKVKSDKFNRTSVYIPAEERDKAGLHDGDKVDVEYVKGGELKIRKI